MKVPQVRDFFCHTERSEGSNRVTFYLDPSLRLLFTRDDKKRG